MIKIDTFRIWGERIIVTNRRIDVLSIKYYDEIWYCIEAKSGISSSDIDDIFQHCQGIGNKIYKIDGSLYFDSESLFNIDLMFNKYDFINA